ncbi:MAG: CapA family protein [Lachnospiraceae bacterium]|nr:CapA family protein [Lachnospiraceae bacterium]
MSETAKLQFFGDISLESELGDCEQLIHSLDAELGIADLRIGNLECVLQENEFVQPIKKIGAVRHADKSKLDFFKKLRIDVAVIANNHIGDCGESGVDSTIKALHESNITSLGAGKNIEKAYESIRYTFHGVTISLLAICENEFGVATEEKYGVAGYNVSRVVKAVLREKEKADHVIIIFHGGNEYCPIPSVETRERYRFLIDMGASAIIGMHTHCPQGYEYYNDGLIVYSLGNFYFPMEGKAAYSTWYEGYVASLRCSKKNVDIDVIPYRYSPLKNVIVPLIGENRDIFDDYIKELNEIIKCKKELQKLYFAWCLYGGKNYACCLDWKERYVLSDAREPRSLEIQNVFRCESHRELLQNYFELVSNNKQNAYLEHWKKLKKIMHIPITIQDIDEALMHIPHDITIKNINYIMDRTENREVYICGAGKVGVNLYKNLRKSERTVRAFLDNNPELENNFLGDTRIESYDILRQNECNNCIFVIAIKNKSVQEEIRKQLRVGRIKDYQILNVEF